MHDIDWSLCEATQISKQLRGVLREKRLQNAYVADAALELTSEFVETAGGIPGNIGDLIMDDVHLQAYWPKPARMVL